MLPKSYVLRTKDGRYLGADGGLTQHRTHAVRLSMRDAGALLHRRPFNDQMWGLSMEECPKRERRQYPPLSAETAAVLLNALHARKHREQAATLLRLAMEAEALARRYRADAKQIVHANQNRTRAITLADDE